MTAQPTFHENQHRRAADGKFANKGWQPKHSMSGKTQVRLGAAGLAVSGMGMVSSAFNLGTAILTVTTVSLLAWGGYKGAKKRKRRKAGAAKKAAPSKTTGTRVSRLGTVRLDTPEKVEAYIQLKEWRSAQWARRRGAAMSAARKLNPSGRAL